MPLPRYVKVVRDGVLSNEFRSGELEVRGFGMKDWGKADPVMSLRRQVGSSNSYRGFVVSGFLIAGESLRWTVCQCRRVACEESG